MNQQVTRQPARDRNKPSTRSVPRQPQAPEDVRSETVAEEVAEQKAKIVGNEHPTFRLDEQASDKENKPVIVALVDPPYCTRPVHDNYLIS